MGELVLLDWIQQVLRTPLLDQLMVAVSTAGNLGAIWVVLGCCLAATKRYRRVGIAVIVAVGLAGVATELVIKPLVMRPRPCEVNTAVTLLVSMPHGSSFPSGHTCAAFAACGALLFGRRSAGFGKPSIGFTATVGVLAAVMGFSRLYLYVHYPTDVLAGCALGIVLGYLAVKLVERLHTMRIERGQVR
ncbi:MAG: phosphatase PAP2 family protein [Eggerthellaceae bacterium]|jgi:undecaprenyl-diphosphatase